MTKKHFEALAREFKDLIKWRGKSDDIEDCIRLVAIVCARENASFDFDRFYRACGL